MSAAAASDPVPAMGDEPSAAVEHPGFHHRPLTTAGMVRIKTDMSIERVSIDLGSGKQLEIETGKMALLCNGSVTVRQGDTMVLIAACMANPRPGPRLPRLCVV